MKMELAQYPRNMEPEVHGMADKATQVQEDAVCGVHGIKGSVFAVAWDQGIMYR